MASRPCKRLFLVVSVCLLLQQFSPAYAFNLSHNKHSKKSHHKKNQYDDREHDNAEKRGFGKIVGTVLRKGWNLLGQEQVIKRINIVAEIGSTIAAATNLGLTVATAIGGCGALAPQLRTNWDRYNKQVEEWKELSSQIDALNLQAKTRELYVNTTFYEYRRTRDKLEEIANEQERIFRSFGPEVVVAAMNSTHEIEKLIEQKNATGQEVQDTEVSLGITKGLELALNLLFPSLTLTFSGVRLLWRTYLKDTVIGKQIAGLPDRIKRKIKSKPTPQSQKVRSGRIMSSTFGKGVQSIGDKIKPKLTKAKKLTKKILKRLQPLASLGAAAFDIWSIFATVKQCTDMGRKSQESVEKMAQFIKGTKQILKNVTASNKDVQSGYDDIHRYLFDDIILDAIKKLKDMMSDPSIVKKTEDSETIVQSLDAFLAGKDLNINIDDNKLEVDELQRNLNDALHRIPFTLNCYVIKVQTFNDVKGDCSRGTDDLKGLYERTKRLKGIDENNQCSARTGSLFPSFENIKAAWEKWASENGDYDKICLMNNPDVVNGVIVQLRKGNDNPESVARKVLKPKAIEEVTAMIEKLRDDPRINQLTMDTQETICRFKETLGSLPAATAVTLITSQKVTPEQYEKQVCPPPKSDYTYE